MQEKIDKLKSFSDDDKEFIKDLINEEIGI